MPEPELIYHPIGIVHSPFRDPQGAPIQPSGARGVEGSVELLPHLAEGLQDLEGFSHLILLYHCHLSAKPKLTVKPFLDDQEHGVFATRAPSRPNPIGLSVVRLLGIEGSRLLISDVDVVDGSPLLDLKPLVPEFDLPDGEVRTGWLSKNAGRAGKARADDRFV